MLLESECTLVYRNNGVYRSVHGADEGRGCMREREKKEREREEGARKRREKGASGAGVSGLSEL